MEKPRAELNCVPTRRASVRFQDGMRRHYAGGGGLRKAGTEGYLAFQSTSLNPRKPFHRQDATGSRQGRQERYHGPIFKGTLGAVASGTVLSL
jgi:hypothetical protein